MKEVREYILQNWTKTFHDPSEMRGDFKVPKPYISPSIGGIYTDLYYWDVYFINLGLMEDGFDEQVENNLDNMAYFIDTLGFMPNANNLTDRSQPPLFCSAVYDYYVHKGEERIIRKYMPYIVKEYDFWQTYRKTKFGLHNFFTNGTEEWKMANYRGLHERVFETRETKEEQLALAEDIMAIAESGLDFNMRFRTKRSKIDASAFIHLDLNCFLYEMETKAAKMLEIIGESPEPFKTNAQERKALMEEYLYDKEQGLYLDRNVVDGGFSEIVSAVSVYPYAYGISTDQAGLKKVVSGIETEKGITVTPNRGKDVYYQWDYPCMWPAATCIIYKAFKTLGMYEDAKRIATKYNTVVDENFVKTGRIWEKYDAVTGGIGYSNEYETPEMMGWTAGVYVYFEEELKKL
jgi:alpha,alpha-trehalase